LPESNDISAIRYEGGVLSLLDQRRLPSDVAYIETSDWRDVAEAIRTLAVRGAPLIGIAAAYALALCESPGELRRAARELALARPTAVNLRWAIDRVVAASAASGSPLAEARAIHEEQRDADRRMGEIGAELLPPSATVLTHCNTGALATGGIGTALGVIRTAHERGLVQRVLVDETRPLLQGARLTAWELQRLDIPHDIIVDSAAAGIIAAGAVDAVIVGADRIAANGDTANKVGTYGLALAARAHGVPFYVVAPVSSIDHAAPTGGAITIEHRDPDEVLTFAAARPAPSGSGALNPAFDVTLSDLVTAIITERGALRSPLGRAIASLPQHAAVSA